MSVPPCDVLRLGSSSSPSRLAVRVAKAYLNLMPAYPGKCLLDPVPFERPEMEYSDECSEFGFHHFFRHPLEFAGKMVLDLGCGYGGRTVRYKELGSRRVVGLEVSHAMVTEAEEFARQRRIELEVVTSRGESLPFADESFDMICAYDVLEHVENVEATLRECYRVLRKDGLLYAVFPPFYHPTNGSHFSGYLSRSPFDNVLFSCRTLLQAAEEIMLERNYTFRLPQLRPADRLWGMNGITVGKFLEILRDVPFANKNVYRDPLLSPLRRGCERWRKIYYDSP